MKENGEDSGQEIAINDESTNVLLRNVLDQAFNVEPDQMLTNSEELLTSLDDMQLGEDYGLMKLAIESIWCYARGVDGIVKGSIDFQDAKALFDQAAHGFEDLGQENARDLSIGMATYIQAAVELRQLNYNKAIDSFQSVEKYLKSAGKFSRKFKPFIDHIKPEMLFTSALPLIQQLDWATAKTLIEEASEASENVAMNYYSDDDREKSMFQGLSYMYRALYRLCRSFSDFQQFEFDRISQDVLTIEYSNKARDLLGLVKDISAPIRLVSNIAEAISLMSEIIHDLAHVVKKRFESSITSEFGKLDELHSKIRKAADFAAKAGPTGIVLVRSCEQLSNQIKNIERLIRPKKKDFGIFSGLVASVNFILLLLMISLANVSFNLGLDPERLITTCMVISLIAGFGFGAVKFKGLLFPLHEEHED